MPAKRIGRWTDNQIEGEIVVKATLTGEESSVYYTTDSPSIEFTVHNDSECKTPDSYVDWFVAIGEGRPASLVKDRVELPALAPDEKHQFSISEELLIEGHCLIGVGRGMARGVTDSDMQVDINEWRRFDLKDTRPEEYTPLLSFPVWDSDHYEVIHGDTKRGQLVSIFASVGIVSFAAFQAVQTLWGAAVGLMVFATIWLLYLYSGYSTRLWESRREFT